MWKTSTYKPRAGRLTLLLLLALAAVPDLHAQAVFRVYPYLQYPTPTGITIRWLTHAPAPGSLILADSARVLDTLVTAPVTASALRYSSWEARVFFDDTPPPPPYLHHLRLDGLRPGTTYTYTVRQQDSTFTARFRTAPASESPVRFIVYADSETEPESTGLFAEWVDPRAGPEPAEVRRYLIDQTRGYANNLDVMHRRAPDFIAIAGDLVRVGDEQRDWDEFWRHNTGPDSASNLAGGIPLLPVPGNHEYLTPLLEPYGQPESEDALARFQTYFDLPPNASPTPEQENRYYRFDYGPITLIGLDVSNNSPDASGQDSNFYLLGENDPGGGAAPDFGPGSRQYDWLEAQLRDAQAVSRFTFVMFHQAPYSSGLHGRPAGLDEEHEDLISGYPVRTLMPLLLRYGVDALFAGHDELFERSALAGEEHLPDGTTRAHTLQLYDVGIGGDDLRGPHPQAVNEANRFLVHRDVPEQWTDRHLVDGGKHYGHLEVTVRPTPASAWEAVFEPVYVFPLFDAAGGTYLGHERRVYPDVLTLETSPAPSGTDLRPDVPGVPALHLDAAYPNPATDRLYLRFRAHPTHPVTVTLYDVLGRPVKRLPAMGSHDDASREMQIDLAGLPGGSYLLSITAPGARQTRRIVVLGRVE